MKIQRYVKSYFLYIAVALLVVSIGLSVYSVNSVTDKKDNELKALKTELSKITDTANKTSEELKDVKSQLEEATESKQKLTEKLKAAQKENENLQKENKTYKAKLEKLSAKEKAEVETQVADKNSPQSKYPKPTKVCYLTFDDGPSNNTLKILKILKKYDAKATFFVVGSAKLEYLPKIKAAGHAIGLHCNNHDYAKIYKSTKAFLADQAAISKKVEKQIGVKTMLMRFPGGSNNTVSKKYCQGVMTDITRQVKIKGYAYFDWNVDSGDASGNNVPVSRITKNVLSQAKNKDSICVLMHDTAAKDTTVQALEDILIGLKKQGYKFEALTEETYGYHFKVAN